MNKPKGYDETKAGGGYTPLALGGHHLIIKKVVSQKDGKQIKTKNGDPMIIVYFDTAENDVQPRYGTIEFQNDVRPDKNWPYVCTKYITTEKEGKCTKDFKTFTTCFAHSNGINDDAIIWGDGFENQFTDKKIGGVVGQVENEYQGKRSMRNEVRWFVTDSKVDEATIPEPKRLNGSTTPTPGNDGFMAIPEGASDSMPWG